MKKIIVLLFFIFCTNLLFAQNDFQSHVVEKGETVYSISKTYKIYRNPNKQTDPDGKQKISHKIDIYNMAIFIF